MENIITIIVMFGLGVILRKTGKVKDGENKTINTLLINVFLPALILFYMHKVSFSKSILFASAMPWLLTVAGIVFFSVIGKVFKFSKETVGCLILTASAGNTAFLGLPIVQALVGTKTLPLAISIDQLGSTPCILTLGVFVASLYSSKDGFSLSMTLKRIATFPPFLATLFAIALNNVDYAHQVSTVLQKLSACVAPLALLSVGMQLNFGEIRTHIKPLTLGLAYRVLLAPLAVGLVLCMAGQHLDDTAKTILIDSMMGTQITALVLTQEYNLNNRLGALMMCLSVPLSILLSSILIYLI